LRVGAAAEIFDWRQVGSGERVTVGALTFTFDQTDHPVTTLAMRVDGAGRSLGYSADTGPGWGLTSLGPALQLALCEATFLSDMEGRLAHLSAREAGRSAREAGVERLVLTHLWPRVDRGSVRRQAEEAFGGPVALAAVGDRYVA
jgi:ribonuclease BN (tRNA processing enzyme)